ncbi:MAG: hypothetical protein U1E05_07500, partial [Patescibacteria group bacterium]|nr:hypothetical protein [Patescibacteria group bacterium]
MMARMDAQPSYRRFPTGARSNRRPLRLEFLEPRLALSGVDVGTLSAPDAPLWAVAPHALCDTSAAMTVKQISGLEYYFRNVTDASHDSGWLTEAENSAYFNYPGYVTYVDQGLTAATPYVYTVKARVGSSGEGGDWSTQATVTTLTAMEAAVQRLTNQIRTIETFSSPDNPGQITSQLANGQYPDPTQPNNFTTCEKSGTHGVAAYPGDGRNTPGAFQVDLANMGKTDPNNPWIEVFGEWKGTAGSAKNASPYDTQIALSKQTLKDFFNLEVSAAGLITRIEARAAAIFLHDDALADAAGWNPVDNPLIGHHIDNFQSEQLALYLAGRDAKDSGVGVSDPRTSHPAILRDAETLQYQVSKSFMWAAYQKFLNHPDYSGTFAKVVDLYGATLSITSSQGTAAVPIFGVKEGDTFKCRLTPAFVLGGTYVRGEGNMIGLLTALVKANEEGSGVWTVDTVDVTFTLTNPGAATVDKVFTVDKTPGNVGASYPSIFHYGAVMSPFGMIDYTADPQTFDPADLILVAGDAAKPAWGVEGRNTAAGLGYTRLAAADIHTVSGTQTVLDGGQYNYRDLEAGKTLTLAGAETFVVLGQSSSAAGPRITSSGYPFNNDKTVSAGQQIDISDYFNEGFVGNNTDILNSSFYGWWGADGQMMARVNDPSVPENTALFLYFAPAAKDLGAAGPQAVLDNQGKFYDTASPYYHTARVGAANVTVLGRPANADAWAAHFLTQAVPPGTGVIDASATTGRVFIVLDKTVEKVKLGTGPTVVIALAENASRKTFVLNPNATVAPTIGLRSGDVIDWSMLPQTVTWTAGAATTFDNKAAATSPYRRYSYYAGWAAQGGLPGAFQAIVRANGNTGTDDPAKIVENALNPLTVTIGRAAGQARQTSASLMNYTVVFSQEVDDFDEDAVHLLGLQDTLSGAQIVITNPGGDRMTYN